MRWGFREGKKRGRRGWGIRWGWDREGSRKDRAPDTCICPECKHNVPHQPGVPCFQTRCPRCGSPMTRRFSIDE